MDTRQIAPLVLILVVLGAGTYVEGKLSERWGDRQSEKLDKFTERLSRVPKRIDDWVGTDDEVNLEEFEQSHCDGYVSRTYVNSDGDRVNMYLVSGTARNVTQHTPDWCYVGAGYLKVEDQNQYEMKCEGVPSDPEFLTAIFRKEEPLMKHEIRIYWTFSDDGNWQGPRVPTAAFAGRPALYKIYLITNVDEVGADPDTNPSLDFARVLLPELQRILFPLEAPSQEPDG